MTAHTSHSKIGLIRKAFPRKSKCGGCIRPMMQNSGSHKHCDDCGKKRRAVQYRAWRIRSGRIKDPSRGTTTSNPENWAGEKNPMWRGGAIDWQRRTFLRKRCERCNSKKELDLHHKDRDRRNASPENLETLCGVCHREERLADRVAAIKRGAAKGHYRKRTS